MLATWLEESRDLPFFALLPHIRGPRAVRTHGDDGGGTDGSSARRHPPWNGPAGARGHQQLRLAAPEARSVQDGGDLRALRRGHPVHGRIPGQPSRGSAAPGPPGPDPRRPDQRPRRGVWRSRPHPLLRRPLPDRVRGVDPGPARRQAPRDDPRRPRGRHPRGARGRRANDSRCPGRSDAARDGGQEPPGPRHGSNPRAQGVDAQRVHLLRP